MTIEGMKVLIGWSMQQCPDDLVKRLVEGAIPPAERNRVQLLVTKHLYFRAYTTIGWMLWTR